MGHASSQVLVVVLHLLQPGFGSQGSVDDRLDSLLLSSDAVNVRARDRIRAGSIFRNS